MTRRVRLFPFAGYILKPGTGKTERQESAQGVRLRWGWMKGDSKIQKWTEEDEGSEM